MDILFALVIIAMVAVLGTLFLGMISMARGGDFDRRNSNRFMRWRVILQGVAIALFVLYVLLLQA